MIFLILILEASTLAIPAPARDLGIEVPAVVAVKSSNVSGVLKNGDTDVDCVELLPDGRFRMVMTGDELTPCRLGFASGLQIRLDKGEIITSETEGIAIHGLVRVYASGIPYRLLGDQRHLVEPGSIVDVVIEDNFTHVLSKEGSTTVVSCEESDDPACVKRGFFLLQGDFITLTRDGQVYDWQNSDGEDLALKEEGGCSTGKGGSSSPWAMIALFWTLMWLRRRRTSDR